VVENWYLLIESKPVTEGDLSEFVRQFRSENCKIDANIYMVDDASIYPLIK
jgi:hypothetical protein